MCVAKATLVYGLTIRSSALFLAADAWTRLSPTFDFFDLIFLRRRAGNLVSRNKNGKGAVTKIPQEVWEEIKKWNVLEELEDSEDGFLSPLICEDSDCEVKPEAGSGVTWEDFSDEDNCELTAAALEQFVGDNIANWTPQTVSELKELLSSFGLALPAHQSILTAEDWVDPSALALISAPTILRLGTSDVPLVEAFCNAGSGPDRHSIVGVSFQLPPDIDQRFKDFIRLSHLQVIDSEINQILPRLKKDKKERVSKNPKSEGVRDRVAKSIKPGWKLYLMCESSWV
ncbi:hypothetical protein JCM3765_004670 [Sporobolomyces pararoseus]